MIKYYIDDNRPSIWTETTYINAWDENGRQTLTDGNGWIDEYDEDSLKTTTRFKNGLADGKTISYYENGRKKQVDTYKENQWIYRVIYYDNGNKYYEFDAKDSPLTYSFTREWWNNGNLKKEELENKIVEYHPNGQLKSFGYYPSDTSSNKFAKDYYLTYENFISNGSEFSFNPVQRKITWFKNGFLKSKVEFDEKDKKLIRTEYYNSGKTYAKGEIKYGDYDFNPEKTINNTDGFTGYLKVGNWNFYNEDELITKSINMDNAALKIRLIGYNGF